MLLLLVFAFTQNSIAKSGLEEELFLYTVPESAPGRTIVEFFEKSNDFKTQTKDHFLVQVLHTFDLLGSYPWTCVLELEEGVKVQQNFTNPRYVLGDVDELANLDVVRLEFKGKFSNVAFITCEEKNDQTGDFSTVINHAARREETAVGSVEVPPWEGHIETRMYHKADCEQEQCEDFYIVMPIIGHGYPLSKKEEFFDLAFATLDSTFGNSPYAEYLPYFQIEVIYAESSDGTIYGSSDERILDFHDLARLTPWGYTHDEESGHEHCRPNHDIPISRLEDMGIFPDFVVNIVSKNCRGNFCGIQISTPDNSIHGRHQLELTQATLMHELGHAFALGDEYIETGKCRDKGEGFRGNLDSSGSLQTSQWKHWDGVSGVGYFEGGGYCEKGVWRPTEFSCMLYCQEWMFPDDQEIQYFSPVHQEQMILAITSHVKLIQVTSPPLPEGVVCDDKGTICRLRINGGWCDAKRRPDKQEFMKEWCYDSCFNGCIEQEGRIVIAQDAAQEFKVEKLLQNVDQTVEVFWTMDGEIISSINEMSITIQASAFSLGRHELAVVARDATPKVRKDDENILEESHIWVLTIGETDPSLVVECQLPTSQRGYSIDPSTTRLTGEMGSECTSRVCDNPEIAGVECAEGYTGTPSAVGCASSNPILILYGCTEIPVTTARPSPAPTILDFYIQSDTHECTGSFLPITDQETCKDAARNLDLEYNGEKSFSSKPSGCYYDSGYFKGVEWNKRQDANPTAGSGQFALCSASGDLDCEGQWSECTMECEKASDRVFAMTIPQKGSGAACPPATDCAAGDGRCTTSICYVKLSDGSKCSSGRITDEATCKLAAESAGISYSLSFSGPNDFPGCLHANDGRNLVYFNSAPNANGANSKYAEICTEACSEPSAACGLVPSSCEGHISWAVSTGKDDPSASTWYPNFQETTNVALSNAGFDDFHHYFYCTEIISDCELLEPLCDQNGDPQTCETIATPSNPGTTACDDYISPGVSGQSGNGFHGDCTSAQIDSDSAQCLTKTSKGYIDIDLGSEETIKGVVTQGRKGVNQWITQFKVKVKGSTGDWSDYILSQTGSQTFIGNTDQNTKVYNMFDVAQQGVRHVRVFTTAYSGYSSIRLGALPQCEVEAKSSRSMLYSTAELEGMHVWGIRLLAMAGCASLTFWAAKICMKKQNDFVPIAEEEI